MIDVILLSNEPDQLDISLHELLPVIIESQSTFSGLPKQLFYKENEQRFAKFKSKTQYIEPPPMPTDMEAEGYTKAWVSRLTPAARGLDMAIRELHPREGDWILLSDLDEILPPSSTTAFGSALSCSANREQESHETRKAHGFGGPPEYDEQKVFLAMIGDNQWRNAGYYMRELRNSPRPHNGGRCSLALQLVL
ncbi:hypothetical protein BGZ74_002940 [Mortierella antarctica]|nr:hypothetical protein BGZ74_002940 [Mortierella antarctica]